MINVGKILSVLTRPLYITYFYIFFDCSLFFKHAYSCLLVENIVHQTIKTTINLPSIFKKKRTQNLQNSALDTNKHLKQVQWHLCFEVFLFSRSLLILL